MPPLYSTDTLAFVAYQTVVIAWVATELFVFISTSGNRGGRREDRGSGIALIGGILLAVWVGSALAKAAPGAALVLGAPSCSASRWQ